MTKLWSQICDRNFVSTQDHKITIRFIENLAQDVIVLSICRQPYARVHFGHLDESRPATAPTPPSGRQLVG